VLIPLSYAPDRYQTASISGEAPRRQPALKVKGSGGEQPLHLVDEIA